MGKHFCELEGNVATKKSDHPREKLFQKKKGTPQKKERHPSVPYKMNSYTYLESLLGKTFKNFLGHPMVLPKKRNTTGGIA
jgi:hypothetical protein